MSTLLLLGATGQVGHQLLNAALAHPAVTQVVAPTRRPLAAHPKLLNPKVDFSDLPERADWWTADAACSALGTTLRQAGSAEAFEAIDRGHVLAAARLTRAAGTPCFVNNSSMGANPRARGLYLRVKGLLEQDLDGLGFLSVCHVRPSLLDGGPRPDSRPGERVGLWLAHTLAPLIPARYQAIKTEAVAQAMLQAALAARPGVQVIESDALQLLPQASQMA